jgi:hypothetical protein
MKVALRKVYFVNSGNWTNVNFYSWYDSINIFTDTWPGNAMTKEEGNIYSCEVPENIPNIIFNDTGSTQTADLVLPADQNQYDFSENQWSVYGVDPTEPTTEPDPTEPESTTLVTPVDGSTPGYLIPVIAAVIVAVAVAVVLIVKKKK